MLEFNERGKFFTDIIRKEPVRALVQVPGYMIRGYMYVHPEKRVKDELDEVGDFVPITDAEVSDLAGNVIYRTAFIAVGKAQVLFVIPIDDIQSQEGAA
jgi:hypothetical protein